MNGKDSPEEQSAQTNENTFREATGEDGAGKLVREPGTEQAPLNDDAKGTTEETTGPAANI